MTVKQLNPGACKTYLLLNESSSEAVLIDPVINHVTMYLTLMRDKGYTLTHIIDTHTHADHISACPSLKDATSCEYIAHELAPSKCVTMRLKDKDELILAGKQVKVLHTPGHTRDSLTLLVEDSMLFTGDFLFLEDAGAGRDDLPGGSPKDHYHSLLKLKNIKDHVMVYPAHEYRNRKPSDMKTQRLKNPHLKEQTEEDFITYINDLKLGPADWMKEVLNANYKCSRDPNAVWIPTDLPACEIKGTMDPNTEDIVVKYITPPKFDKYIKENPSILLLDVREKYELAGDLGHLDKVMNIPIGSLTDNIDQLNGYAESNIILICRSGARATSAARILFTAGFTNIYVLDGGMLGYRSHVR